MTRAIRDDQVTDTYRYALLQRALHWLIVLLVLGLLGVGMLIGSLGFDGLKANFGIETTNTLYAYHKTFGVLVLGLMALRLILRLTLGPPPYREPLSPFKSAASRTVHGLFYLLLLAMPILGWMATAAGGYPVQFFDWNLPGFIGKNEKLSETLFELHELVGWTLIGLILIHVGAALTHWLVWKDGVMERMGLFGNR